MAFCYNCGAEVSETAKFCKKCGFKVEVAKPQDQRPATVSTVTSPTSDKNMAIAIILSLGVGILIWGIGHIYIGKTTRGIIFIVADIIQMIFSFLVGIATGGLGFVLFLFIWLAGYIIQGLDAYNLAKKSGIK